METAVERYRTGRVIPPQGIGTSASYQPDVERPEQHDAGRTDRDPVGGAGEISGIDRLMRIGRSPSPDSNRTRVVVLTADAEFDRSARATFGASSAIELTMVTGRIAEHGDTLDVADATVVVVDLDAGSAEEMAGAGAADGARARLAAGRSR